MNLKLLEKCMRYDEIARIYINGNKHKGPFNQRQCDKSNAISNFRLKRIKNVVSAFGCRSK